MSNNDTYNGWANRETWAFWLHVGNDEGLYESVREWAQGWIDAQNADAQDDYADSSLGAYVAESVHEYLLETQPHSDHARMVLNEVGSWWRINHAEIGAAVREDLDN